MEAVVGLTVWVKLKDQVVVYGVVEALTPGSHLTLGNGMLFIDMSAIRQ